MEDVMSPIRVKRLDEKTSLQSLNNRLELYVLRVKEIEDQKNAVDGELHTVRQRMQKDIEAVRGRLGKELEETRKDLEYEIDQKTRLQVLEQEQHTELVKLRAEVKELRDARTEMQKYRSLLEKEQQSSQDAKVTLSNQATELQALKRKISVMDKEARKTNATLNNLEGELKVLRAENAEFIAGRDDEVTDLRNQMNIKMQENRTQWKEEADGRVAKAENEIRSHFETVVSGYKDQVSDLMEEIEGLKADLDKTSQDYDDSLKSSEVLLEKLTKLEAAGREDRKQWKDEKKALENALEKARNAKVAKDQEFNLLMDVKIALDQEIAAYRSILEKEESRVGLPTPKNKRKAGGSRSAASGKRKKVSKEPIRIRKLNLSEDCVVLENITDKDVPMKGWLVISEVGKQQFSFPEDYVLAANGAVTVWSGKKSRPKQGSNIDLFWTKKFLWNTNGDAAVLVSDKGEAVHRVVEGLEDTSEEASSDESDELQQPESGCAIM